MSRALAVIRAMRERGLCADDILAVVEAMEDAQPQRTKNAERQARFRERKAAEKAATVTNNVTHNAVTPAKENFPTPLKENNPPSKETPPKGGSKKGSRLSADWHPSGSGWQFAISTIGEPAAKIQLARFVDFWIAKPGAAGLKLDWEATWRNWVRSTAERTGVVVPLTQAQPPPKSKTPLEIYELQIADYRERGEEIPQHALDRLEKLRAEYGREAKRISG